MGIEPYADLRRKGSIAVSDRPLHVGIDATCWSNDRGYGRFTRELVKALAGRANGVRYTLVFDHPPSGPIPAGVEVLVAGSPHALTEQLAGTGNRSPSYLLRLGRLASRAGFDVFFFPTVYSYFPLLSRTACVVCYHDTIAERFPDLIFPTRRNFRLWQIKTAMSKLQARRAMTVSESSAREIETVLKIPRRKIDVITEGPNPAFRVLQRGDFEQSERERFGVPLEAQLLVYLGGFNRHKNVTGLLRAMPRVLTSHPNVHLALVGDTSGGGFWDNVPELREIVGANPILKRAVSFTGYLADDVLVKLLNSASALVLPSLAEGFGLPAIEAMACGVPVLASDRGSLPEVVGHAGLLFDPEDPDDIAACLSRFLNDPALRARLAAATADQVRRFTWARAAELAEASFRRCAQIPTHERSA